MKVVCIVQARMGSSRLPGKVLVNICGKSVLEHDIDRLKRVKSIDEIVIATTTLEKDNVIVDEAKRLGITFFRGSEEDVLSRYYHAAKENNADVIVRVTSDCPLIDSEVTEKTIQFYIKNSNKYDYASNSLKKTYPRGLDTEVFSYEILKRAFYEANDKKDREHVTAYIWRNPNIFNLGCYESNIDYSDLRWTLDTNEDLELINQIYNHLYNDKGNNFNMNDILKLYEKHPELRKINMDIKQKEL